MCYVELTIRDLEQETKVGEALVDENLVMPEGEVQETKIEEKAETAPVPDEVKIPKKSEKKTASKKAAPAKKSAKKSTEKEETEVKAATPKPVKKKAEKKEEKKSWWSRFFK